MNLSRGYRRWAWVVGLVILLAVVASHPHFGFTKGTETLWTDRPVAGAPATVPPTPWVEIAKVLRPAVVNISTKRLEAPPLMPAPFRGNDPFDQFFRQFFGNQPPHAARSLGSGFIIDSNRYILTNNHVIDEATEVRVKLSDGREPSAKIVGRDAKTDLALLKIDTTGLPVISLGDSARLQVGEPAMAIGKPQQSRGRGHRAGWT